MVYTGWPATSPADHGPHDFARPWFRGSRRRKGKNNPSTVSATPDSVAEEAERKRMNPKMLAAFVDGTKTMVEMAAVANAVGFHPDVPNMHGPKETVPNRLGSLFSLKGEGGILLLRRRGLRARGCPRVFVIVRSGAEPVRETMEYLGMGAGPNHVFYRPYHLTSLETPISVARAAIYGEPTIISQDRPVAEVVAVAKRTSPGEKLGGIGSADYYGGSTRTRRPRCSRWASQPERAPHDP